ncbi:hypothetical protein AMS68_007413 [Peltaster fructicola]|uniref:DBF4-type domain-containing protein n=1 Tax=Peltaster fructicola TaxID=286661 RepID=A0A6H0Y4K8_9PEZI|nr:hypothetical protein AMS68_007413 [Peltaster fructicola]
MASKRLPLANVPNAINSPYRHGTAGKRTRAQAGDVKESVQDQPPAKKQLLEYRHQDEENVDPRRKVIAVEEQFLKRPANAQPTALERKLAASRERKPTTLDQRIERVQKVSPDSLESIRQWQRHYRRQFPHFVFYFDGISDDMRSKLQRQILSLGAREEKYFCSTVTHVVTGRQIPPENASQPAATTRAPPQTIAPSALANDQRKITSMLDNTLQRRVHDLDNRRVASQADVLTRARELNVKIWALEKVQRVLKTMLEAVTGEQGATFEVRQPTPALEKPAVKAVKDADLEQLLRNEKINGPADRDMTVVAQDMCAFKGCYIYIHDMDEKTKPVMVRDYPKVASKDQGKWPQFRNSAVGRCPFIEDPSYQRSEQERRQAKDQRRTRSVAEPKPEPLAERPSNLRRSPRKLTVDTKDDLSKPLAPPKLVPTKRTLSNEEMPATFGSAQMHVRGVPRMIGGVPIASGMQHSNVTSAIRSQAISSAAISSTAAGMGRRLPDSKEVSVLKRKVLERTTSVPSQLPSSYMNDMRAAINDESAAPQRAAKRKAQENILGVVHEDEEAKPKKRAAKRSKAEKDPKPGYCENCRDKFDDFDEHCLSRKHQKFARSASNWKELDDLLKKLKRPHKEY